MSPLSSEANGAVIFAGAKFEPIEKTLIDVGYNYYNSPNQAAVNARSPGGKRHATRPTNSSVYNSSNEIYAGVAFAQWKDIATPSFYVYYNFDLAQTTTEFALRRTFRGDDYGIAGAEFIVAAYAGYLQADAYNGDQRSGVEKWSNAYALPPAFPLTLRTISPPPPRSVSASATPPTTTAPAARAARSPASPASIASAATTARASGTASGPRFKY